MKKHSRLLQTLQSSSIYIVHGRSALRVRVSIGTLKLPDIKFQTYSIVASPVFGAATLAGGLANLLVVVPHLIASADTVAGTGNEDLAAAALGTVSLAGAVVFHVSKGDQGEGDASGFLPRGAVVDVVVADENVVDSNVAVADDWEGLAKGIGMGTGWMNASNN